MKLLIMNKYVQGYIFFYHILNLFIAVAAYFF